jgi:ATP-binding cassette subfamily B protein
MIKDSAFRRLLSYIAPQRGVLVLALALAVVSVALTLAAPVLVGDAIDKLVGVNDVDFDGVLRIVAMLAATILVAALSQWAMTLCTNAVTHQTVKNLRTDAFARLENVPLSYIDETAHGDIMNRMTLDVDQIADGLILGFSQLFTGILTIIGTLAFMFSINAPTALVVALITPLSLFVASYIARHGAEMFRRQSRIRGELSGFAEEMIGNIKTVKAFSREEHAEADFGEINKRLYDCGWLAQFYSALVNPSTRFVNGLVYAGVGIAGAIAAINGSLTVGQLTCFLTYASQYTKPFNEISGVVAEFQAALASARRIFDMLDEPVEKPDAPDALDMKECDGSVRLEGVSFSYSPDQKLLDHINIIARKGERIAIVGPTGCGKTTLINLLMRFYDPVSGRIVVSGVDTANITRDSLRSMFGMVLQDTWVFSGTVRDNIAYGRQDATYEQVVAAGKAAHAHSFIRRLPDGYDTVISEDGSNLSEGQKQLLSIARVMLVDPPMLILDEATSSIDTRTELKIQRALDEMMRGRTCFIVAHRLSTIREADRIIVIRNGRIIEAGKHNELLAQDGFYKKLYLAQYAPLQ